MILFRQRDFEKAGIYCIRNIVNDKKYVGKSLNIYERIRAHINKLNKHSKDENMHFKSAWHKYGRHNFEYTVLEYCEKRDDILKERELYWMLQLDTLDRNKGYNLRLDSETKMIVSDETRIKLSIAQKKRFSDPKEREKSSKTSKITWSDKDRVKRMSDKLKIINSRYKFKQYSRDGVFIEEFETISHVLIKHPSLRKQNVYQVCYGQKPTHGGYVWTKELKI